MMEGVVRKKSRRVRMVLMRMAFIHHTASDTDRFSLEGQSDRGQSRYSPYETCKSFIIQIFGHNLFRKTLV